MATTNMRIVIRRDTFDNWFNNGSVVLLSGEQGYETDRGRMKIGDGTTVWSDLPYYTGGITGIDGDTIIMDAAGVIMLNSDSVIGDIGDSATIKEYIDTQDDALAVSIANEAAARETGDTALGARIDALTVASENGDTALAAQLEDSITTLSDRSESSDAALQLQIGFNQSAINVNADGIAGLDTQLTNVKNESQAADVAINLRIDTVDAKFGSLTAPGQPASDNVTDFVGLVTGNLGGVNVKTYSDAGDSVLGGQITALQAVDADLGGQINAGVAADVIQDARLDALEVADTVESAARIAADAVQDGRLDDLEVADTVESAARIAGDATLQSNITANEVRITALEDDTTGATKDQVNGVQANVNINDDRITALEDDTTGATKDQVNAVQANVNTNDNRINHIVSDMAALPGSASTAVPTGTDSVAIAEVQTLVNDLLTALKAVSDT